MKQQDTETDNGKSDDKNVKQAKSCSKWTPSELNALIKATGVYPVGTVERWEKVARYIVDHVPGSLQKSEKEVISQVDSMFAIHQHMF